MRDEEERPAAKDGESMMNYGIPALSCDQLSLWFQEDDDHPHAPSCSGSIVLKDILPPAPPPGFELPRPAAVAGSKEVDGDGEGSGGKRQHASSHMQTRDEGYYEDGAKEDSKTSNECRQQKRMRSTEVHNLNERLRRQKLKEKMKTLQELIPNCNKRDKASTLDDAIKYIKTLQCHVQMMSMGAGVSMLRSPTMMPQPGHQGMQVPSFPPFLHTVPGGPGAGIGCGMGISSLSSSAGFGLRSSSSLPGISEAVHNQGNVLGMSPFACSSMDWRPMYAAIFTHGSQCTPAALDGGGGSPSSQCAMSSKNESCQVPVTGEVGSPSSCSLEGQSKEGVVRARVLPSQVIRPRFVQDDGSSHTGSSEWASAKSGDSCF